MRMLDLSKEAVRHGGGVQPGSTAEAMAIAAAEWLIDEADVDEEMLVGELLDVGWLAERRQASGIASAIEVMEDEDKVWLAKEVYDRLDMVERACSGTSAGMQASTCHRRIGATAAARTDGGMRASCNRQGRGGGRQQANGRLATLETLGDG